MSSFHGSTTAVPEAVGVSTERLVKLEEWQRSMVDQGRLPCAAMQIYRKGKLVHNYAAGYQQVESATPATDKTIYRMFSMTKPVVSAALMMLVEEGKAQISDPVHLHLGPKWKKSSMAVYKQGSYDKATKGYETIPCTKNITIKMLLTHTSGLSYGFDYTGAGNKVDRIYRDKTPRRPPPPEADGGDAGLSEKAKKKKKKERLYASFKPGGFDRLEGFVDWLVELPLVFQPGSAWHYGYNTDVVGRLVEVISGQTLEEFLQERVFVPLK
eukprot:gene17324-7704_t